MGRLAKARAAKERHTKAAARARAARERRAKHGHRVRRERLVKGGRAKERMLKKRTKRKVLRRHCVKWSKVATSLVQLGHHRVKPAARRCLKWRHSSSSHYKWVTRTS